jgi:hypothetical protein
MCWGATPQTLPNVLCEFLQETIQRHISTVAIFTGQVSWSSPTSNNYQHDYGNDDIGGVTIVGGKRFVKFLTLPDLFLDHPSKCLSGWLWVDFCLMESAIDPGLVWKVSRAGTLGSHFRKHSCHKTTHLGQVWMGPKIFTRSLGMKSPELKLGFPMRGLLQKHRGDTC